ncbi:MAG: futalosine hydrolase [Bacteroidota bacterium]|nr:futalosine hydrolase [Bacteroidota bacterium]MDP4206696.1 futalosine hydrolase [Bacteroidota bacterium]
MRVLLVTATRFELVPFEDELTPLERGNDKLERFKWGDLQLDVLVCGIGMISVTYKLTKILLSNSYDCVINAGIAGSYQKKLRIGTVVNVVKEQFSALGIERTDSFQTLFEAGFLKPNQFPYHDGTLINPGFRYIHDIPEVNGITSNIIHLSEKKIQDIRQKFNPDVESTEGAAVFYVCLQQKIPFLQLRAISNYVEDSDKCEWNIPLALENLSLALFSVLNRLEPASKRNRETMPT